MAMPVAKSISQALLIVFAFAGQRMIEYTRRRAFVLKLEAETQRIALEKEKEYSRHKALKILKLKTSQKTLYDEVKKVYNKKTTQNADRCPSPHAKLKKKKTEDGFAPEANFGNVLSHPWGSIPLTPQRSDDPDDFGEEMEFYNPVDEFPELEDTALAHALPGDATTDWVALNRAVARIRDTSYCLRDFHNDMLAAFPELGLYTYGVDDPVGGGLSSGRSCLEELARTIGALYSVYWLMRLDLDGKLGFCFGYSDEWQLQSPCDGPSPSELKDIPFFKLTESERKLNFYHHFTWGECTKLCESAGLFSTDSKGKIVEVNARRLRALLVLTAIHDVMKNENLCPTVCEKHSPFDEFKTGDVIRDHDAALDYVLTFYGRCFPSYRGLDEDSQRVIRFTQGKMGFNNGWLVQGEAPPGALFAKFKELIQSGGAIGTDVSFYFVHWVTDLAGAEATPLQGAVKFVQRFPQFVLESFFRSFPYVWKLSERSECEVVQEYLLARWRENSKLGLVPRGEAAIAIMRLALQAQSHADCVLPAFEKLLPAHRKVLVAELSRTGLTGQQYDGVAPCEGYPALLIYYSPAFLQKNWENLVEALTILAQVFSLGRELIPLQYDSKEETEAKTAEFKANRESRKAADKDLQVTYYTLAFKGSLGMKNTTSGHVFAIEIDGQASKLGVQEGWQIVQIEDTVYSSELLQAKIAAGTPYHLTLKEVTSKAGNRRRSLPSNLAEIKADSPRLQAQDKAKSLLSLPDPTSIATAVPARRAGRVHSHRPVRTTANHTATIRIEVLKDLKISEIFAPRTGQLKDLEGMFLVKRGNLEAVIEKHPLSNLNTLMASNVDFKFLL